MGDLEAGLGLEIIRHRGAARQVNRLLSVIDAPQAGAKQCDCALGAIGGSDSRPQLESMTG